MWREVLVACLADQDLPLYRAGVNVFLRLFYVHHPLLNRMRSGSENRHTPPRYRPEEQVERGTYTHLICPSNSSITKHTSHPVILEQWKLMHMINSW